MLSSIFSVVVSNYCQSVDFTTELAVLYIMLQLAAVIEAELRMHRWPQHHWRVADIAPTCSAHRARSRLLSHTRSQAIRRCNSTADLVRPHTAWPLPKCRWEVRDGVWLAAPARLLASF